MSEEPLPEEYRFEDVAAVMSEAGRNGANVDSIIEACRSQGRSPQRLIIALGYPDTVSRLKAAADKLHPEITGRFDEDEFREVLVCLFHAASEHV